MLFNFKSYLVPDSLGKAYDLLEGSKSSVILGGTTFLKMSNKSYSQAIDLSKLGLDKIEERDDDFVIGAYVTYGDIERHKYLSKYADAILVTSTKNIIGNQFRNSVTIGASIFRRYGFSDFITALLVLDCQVLLYKNGQMPLREFLQADIKKDILTHLIIKKENIKADFLCVRSSKSNFSFLNMAVSKIGHKFLIAYGARPQRSILATQASEFLSNNEITKENIEKASQLVLEEVHFGCNSLASSEYRKMLSVNLLKRGLCKMEGLDEY